MSAARDVSVQAPAAEILRRRAAQLARPPAPAQPAGALQVLACSVGEQRCLLEVPWLREVLPLRDLLPLPMAAHDLLGLAQWRGRMLPVLDLAALLGAPSAPSTPARRLLVLASASAVLAVPVTEVHGIQSLTLGEVEQRSQALDKLGPDIVRGVTREGQLLLDGERLLALQPGARP
jgi:purine-binding chemotaxis protein CheW